MPREKQLGHTAYTLMFFVAPSVSINATPIAFALFIILLTYLFAHPFSNRPTPVLFFPTRNKACDLTLLLRKRRTLVTERHNATATI